MNFKHLLVSAGLAAIALGQVAAAADLPSRPVYREPAMVAAPVANWTGWYVGVGGGGGLFHAENSLTAVDPTAGLGVANNGTAGGKGYYGRGQTGFDVQFGSFVVGIYGDYDFSSIKGTVSEPFSSGNIPLKQTSAWAGGGRVGFLVMPQFMTYWAGGYAHANFKGGPEVFNVSCTGCLAGLTGITLPNQNYNGYFLGGGTEYMLFPGWFVRSEYRWASYSSTTTNLVVAAPATAFITRATFTTKPVVQTITAELVYKFNWGQ